MLPIPQKIKEDNKKKKVFARVLNNGMMAIAYKISKQDRYLYYGFFLWKLHREFGFTAWEIANFTGIPARRVRKYWEKIKPFLKSDILKNLARIDSEGHLHEYREISPPNASGNDFYIMRDYPAWFGKDNL